MTNEATVPLRVGLIQSCATPDPAQNVKSVVSQVREAAAKGARLVALPEAVDFLHPDNTQFREYAKPIGEHQAVLRFQDVARELSIWILVGSVTTRAESGDLANRSLVISPAGKIRATYDKIHLFDASPGTKASSESRMYQRGNKAVVVKADDATLGLSICYDLRFPHLYRALARNGANVLAVPSAFMVITGKAHWHTLLRARAIETGCFVIAPAQCGVPHADRESFGHSLVVNPWGEIIAEAGVTEAVIVADLNIDEVAEARRRIPSLSQNFEFTVATC